MTVTTTNRLSFELPARLHQAVAQARTRTRKTRLVVVVDRARLMLEHDGQRRLVTTRLMGYLTVDVVVDP